MRSERALTPTGAGGGWSHGGGYDNNTGIGSWGGGGNFGAWQAGGGGNLGNESCAAGQGQGGKRNEYLQNRDAALEQAALAALGLDDSDDEEEVPRPGGRGVGGDAPVVGEYPQYFQGIAYNGEEQGKRWPEEEEEEEEEEAMLQLLLG